jgi:hypothetical protein
MSMLEGSRTYGGGIADPPDTAAKWEQAPLSPLPACEKTHPATPVLTHVSVAYI